MSQTPVVTFDVDSSKTRRELLLLCSLPDRNAIQTGLWAEVAWFVGGRRLSNKWEVRVTDLPHRLREEDWRRNFTMGKEVNKAFYNSIIKKSFGNNKRF